MKVHALVPLVALGLLAGSKPALADTPLRGRSLEATANTAGMTARVEAGDRSRAGALVGYDFRGEGLTVGATVAQVAARHRKFELRGYTRLSVTRFGAAPTGLVAGARIGVRSVLRSKHVGFWLGPMLDTASELGADPQQRITPALGAGFGGGPDGPWPWLWASTDLGYTFGGETRGAVTAAWYLSLVFQR